ncbi:MAG: tRNA (uridine(34)/cytosine(34)/5-carboxymethylaminomethyluridine(34)-2'-O)-methyltransferase TrmL [Gammaproteobacteria bacterium]
MFHIVLFQPEIPPNTGNIIRLCANTGARLHLIRPFGFELEDRKLRRAGLDYREWAEVQVYDSYSEFVQKTTLRRLYALSTRGSCRYDRASYVDGDGFIFGPETRGLPVEILESLPATNRLYIPMLPRSRSLNLSNSVALVVYEAWRQLHFDGAARQD